MDGSALRMITPLLGTKLVQRAYGAAFVASGLPLDLSADGMVFDATLWGTDGTFLTPYGFLAHATTSPTQVIALRGTDSTVEWVEDAQIEMVRNPFGPGLLHSGFLAISESLGVGPTREAIGPHIVDLSALVVVAHSLGAPLGRLLAMRLGHVGQIMTWGEPRSCNGDAAGYALNCFRESRRAINPRDLVPMLPVFDPCRPLDGYRHIGEPLKLSPTGNNPIEAHQIGTYMAIEQTLASMNTDDPLPEKSPAPEQPVPVPPTTTVGDPPPDPPDNGYGQEKNN